MKKRHNLFSKTNLGTVMVEALAVIALIIIITPMIYTRAVEYSYELEDGATASKLRLLRQGVYGYMEANYEDIIEGNIKIGGSEIGELTANEDFTIIPIDDEILQQFVRPEYYANSKMFDDVLISLNRRRLDNGTIVINSMIATTSDNPTERMNETRGRRIASLIGSDAGFTDETIASGAGGFFEIDVDDYFNTNPPTDNQLIISTGFYPSNISLTATANEDYLFRKVNTAATSYDAAKSHRMETDIDFTKFAADGSVDGGFSVVDVNAITGKQYIPESGNTEDLTDFSHTDEDGNNFITYGVNLADGSAFLEDARVSSLGGAKITEALPRLILMGLYTDIDYGYYVPEPGYDNPRILKKTPGCPYGYEPKYELIQKEALTGFDTLAIAKHEDTYVDGIHSTKSWLRNNKLRRSTHIDEDAGKTYFRVYSGNTSIVNECTIESTDGSEGNEDKYICYTIEYDTENNPRIAQQCSINRTVYYDIRDDKTIVDDFTNLPKFSQLDTAKKWGDYNAYLGAIKVYKDPNSNPVLETTTSANKFRCRDINYCPEFFAEVDDDVEFTANGDYVNQFMQQGNCQAVLNTIIDEESFLPYENSAYTQIDGDGTTGAKNQTVNENTVGIDPEGGIYYNTRIYYKKANIINEIKCPDGTSHIPEAGIDGLCQTDSPVGPAVRRYTVLPVKHDMYYYCAKKD